MKSQRQSIKWILSHRVIVHLHVVEKTFFIAQVEVMLQPIVDGLEPERASSRPFRDSIEFLAGFQLVDELGAAPLGPEEVDVAEVAFVFGAFVFVGGGKRARLRCVPPRPILHYGSYQGRIIALANFIAEIERLEWCCCDGSLYIGGLLFFILMFPLIVASIEMLTAREEPVSPRDLSRRS